MPGHLNLIDGGIQHSNLFLHMPIFDEIRYAGQVQGEVRRYNCRREEQACTLLSLNVIRQEELFLWEASEDFIKTGCMLAATQLHGVFQFDLLTVDFQKEIKTFSHNEIMAVLVNTARRVTDGGERLVRYSSLYGVMRKLVHEDWGKIVLKTSVRIFKDKPVFFDLLVKELIQNFEFTNDPGILLVNDLSKNPLYEPNNAEQHKRLSAVIAQQIPQSIEFPPEVYIQDNRGVRELYSLSLREVKKS